MNNSAPFDVVIAGAGISGLLIASELSRTQKVLLIESQLDLQYNKFWVTLQACVTANPHLSGNVDLAFDAMDFSDAYRNQFRLTGNYVLWDTVLLMQTLKTIIEKNGSKLLFGQRFCGYRYEPDSINIFSNDECFKTKLFIDCMGYHSPLVLAKDLIRFSGYYILQGAKLKLKKTIDPICLSNVILDKSPKYFEVFPTSRGEAFATMIYPSKTNIPEKTLADVFQFIIRKSQYAGYFEKDKIENHLQGIVPVGEIRKKALNRIIFFGESAQSNPAATGTCLTRLLLTYKDVSSFINNQLLVNDLSKEALSTYPTVLNPFIRKLQLHAFKDILSWNSDKYAKFISIINHVDHEIINKFIFGDLTFADLANFTHFRKLIKPKNFFLVKPLLQTILKST